MVQDGAILETEVDLSSIYARNESENGFWEKLPWYDPILVQ